MDNYIQLGKDILKYGEHKKDRTGVGTLSLFGDMLKFDVTTHAPFLTNRKLPLRNVIGELLWFIEGNSDVEVLKDDYRCSFWDNWMSPVTKTIGPMYGKQWRDSNGVDQLKDLLNESITYPNSRRLIVNTWVAGLIPDNYTEPQLNPENDKMALAPCHFSYQIVIYEKSLESKVVDLLFNMRSSDYLVGLGSNIASYYILQALICGYLSRKTGISHTPRTLNCSLGDMHIYVNHIDECNLLFNSKPAEKLPSFNVTEKCIDVFESYFNGNFNKEIDKPAIRRKNVTTLYASIENYKPDLILSPARNV